MEAGGSEQGRERSANTLFNTPTARDAQRDLESDPKQLVFGYPN